WLAFTVRDIQRERYFFAWGNVVRVTVARDQTIVIVIDPIAQPHVKRRDIVRWGNKRSVQALSRVYQWRGHEIVTAHFHDFRRGKSLRGHTGLKTLREVIIMNAQHLLPLPGFVFHLNRSGILFLQPAKTLYASRKGEMVLSPPFLRFRARKPGNLMA